MKTRESAISRWSKIVGEHGASGLSVAEFCRHRDLSPPSFYAWRRRLRSEPAPTFVEVEVDEPQNTALELLLPHGRRVLVRRGFDHDLLRELVGVLETWA